MATRRSEADVGETTEVDMAPSVNEVRLVGRVSGAPQPRTLPSGDEVVQLRLVVRRPPERGHSRSTRGPAGPGGDAVSRPVVDTIDVSCWSPLTRRAVGKLADGDMAEIEGSLRRRFYRAGPAVQSRYDVVAAKVRRTKGGG